MIFAKDLSSYTKRLESIDPEVLAIYMVEGMHRQIKDQMDKREEVDLAFDFMRLLPKPFIRRYSHYDSTLTEKILDALRINLKVFGYTFEVVYFGDSPRVPRTIILVPA